MAYKKLTNPLRRGDDFVYPITISEQVVTDVSTGKRLDTELSEKMPKSGGQFTNRVTAYDNDYYATGGHIRNIRVTDSSNNNVATGKILMIRK